MTVELLESGAVLTFGIPSRRGFWEEVKIGRYKLYIEYLYSAVEKEPHIHQVSVDVYRARGKRWRLVRTWRAGEVRTKLTMKAVRVRVGRGALQRLDEIKAALQWFILDGVQQHAENVA